MKYETEIYKCSMCDYQGEYHAVSFGDESLTHCPDCESLESLKYIGNEDESGKFYPDKEQK